MSNITRRPPPPSTPAPKVDEAALAAFIGGAPDGVPAAKAEAPTTPRKLIGKQTAITLALPPELLEKVDQKATSLSITRAVNAEGL